MTDMYVVLDALDVLVVNNCMTAREALEKAYMAGHRQAVQTIGEKKLEVINGGNSTSTGKQ